MPETREEIIRELLRRSGTVTSFMMGLRAQQEAGRLPPCIEPRFCCNDNIPIGVELIFQGDSHPTIVWV